MDILEDGDILIFQGTSFELTLPIPGTDDISSAFVKAAIARVPGGPALATFQGDVDAVHRTATVRLTANQTNFDRSGFYDVRLVHSDGSVDMLRHGVVHMIANNAPNASPLIPHLRWGEMDTLDWGTLETLTWGDI